MSTTTMHISLSDSLKEHIKDRVEEERYSNPSDYVRALIREDLKHRDKQKLEQMLLHGLESGSRELTPTDWQTLKGEILSSLKQ
jgi:antitoxin ParD1/3/4